MKEKKEYEVGYKKPPVKNQFKKGEPPKAPGSTPSTISGLLKHYAQSDKVEFHIKTTTNGVVKSDTHGVIENNLAGADKSQKSINQLIAVQLLNGAVGGDLNFIREVLDRTEGKAPQTVNVNRAGRTVVRPDIDGSIIIEDEITETDESEAA